MKGFDFIMIMKKKFKTMNVNGEEIEIVNILNMKQVHQYIKYGLKPLDVYIDKTTDKMIFVFDRFKSYDLYVKWCNRELN